MPSGQLSHVTHHIHHRIQHWVVTSFFANKCSLIGTTSNNFTKPKQIKTTQRKIKHEHVYHLGNLVLLLNPAYEPHTKRKLLPPTEGPYPITEIFTNGMGTIQCGHLDEIISIQRIQPYHVRVQQPTYTQIDTHYTYYNQLHSSAYSLIFLILLNESLGRISQAAHYLFLALVSEFFPEFFPFLFISIFYSYFLFPISHIFERLLSNKNNL